MTRLPGLPPGLPPALTCQQFTALRGRQPPHPGRYSPWESANEIASWGGLAILAASASYGVSYVYMGKFLANKGIPPIMLSASQLGAGAVLMVFTLPFGGLVAPHWRLDANGSLFILGVLGTGLAYVLNYRLIADEGPTAASTTTYLLPLVAVGLGALVVNETVTLSMIAGMIVVLGGVALVQRRPASPAASEPSPPAAEPITRRR